MFLGDPVDRNFFPGTRYRRPEMKTVAARKTSIGETNKYQDIVGFLLAS